MASAQGSALAIAVSNAGALGSLPCGMLSIGEMRAELAAIKAATRRPFNANFFAFPPPRPDPVRDAAWQALLAPYYRELGIDPGSVSASPGRAPFNHEA